MNFACIMCCQIMLNLVCRHHMLPSIQTTQCVLASMHACMQAGIPPFMFSCQVTSTTHVAPSRVSALTCSDMSGQTALHDSANRSPRSHSKMCRAGFHAVETLYGRSRSNLMYPTPTTLTRLLKVSSWGLFLQHQQAAMSLLVGGKHGLST